MLKISGKALRYSVLFGLLCAIFLSFSNFNANCEDLRQNVLRLHIIANSDSLEDQALKLKIRDRILEKSDDIFFDSITVDDAISVAESKIAFFKEIANEVIAEEGFGYSATATVGDSFFETREYENFTLPAGTYKSLIINVGESRGKNWWCVIFPEMCLPAANADLSETVSRGGTEVAENYNRYKMRFKTVEIYEEIKKLFKK